MINFHNLTLILLKILYYYFNLWQNNYILVINKQSES
jgi:hypothetical protein